ncbi:unnamed protein product, partial [Ectocarpus sp. 4 AP-2014]
APLYNSRTVKKSADTSGPWLGIKRSSPSFISAGLPSYLQEGCGENSKTNETCASRHAGLPRHQKWILTKPSSSSVFLSREVIIACFANYDLPTLTCVAVT